MKIILGRHSNVNNGNSDYNNVDLILIAAVTSFKTLTITPEEDYGTGDMVRIDDSLGASYYGTHDRCVMIDHSYLINLHTIPYHKLKMGGCLTRGSGMDAGDVFWIFL